ncbi:MAG: hypothetical protein IJG60_04625 [Thermoguttaceae bacterium]|nr:hypothetical protein [Thermoguttaceae bacterium]
MDLRFDSSLALSYRSQSQRIRVMSEAWMAENMYCPVCGHLRLSHLSNNKPVEDFLCEHCRESFELKSFLLRNPMEPRWQKKLNDGECSTAIERIKSNTNPSLFVLAYSPDYEVSDLVLIPRFFFVPDIIEERKPLKETARRAGWTGCNILIGNVPRQGKIDIIRNRNPVSRKKVVMAYDHLAQLNLAKRTIETRGWLLDVLTCVNEIQKPEFDLDDVYRFEERLSQKHPGNNNIRPKIRQQLQFLRDKGFIEFLSPGRYRKIN